MQKSDWAYTPLSKEKDLALQIKGVPDALGDELALHHQISRVYLESIGRQLEEILTDKKVDVDLKKAAGAFWSTVTSVVPVKLREQSSSYIKVLCNMPLNLEIGPQHVLDNPGIGFDANTVLIGDGKRELTAVSACLLKVQNAYMQGSSLDKGVWNAMSTWLEKAQQAFNKVDKINYLAVPYFEQWAKQAKQGGGFLYQRKGKKLFLGSIQGIETFSAVLGGGIAINTWHNSQTVVGEHIIPQAIKASNGDILPLRVFFTEDTLYHICVRHTYRYFHFGAHFKAVNSFWPSADMGTNAVHNWVIRALPVIANTGCKFLKWVQPSLVVQIGTNTEFDAWEGEDGLLGKDIWLSEDETVYFIAQIEVGDVTVHGAPVFGFQMEIKTATLDAGAQAYTIEALMSIGANAKIQQIVNGRHDI